jgi:NhaA family Na+:H+ antiporter
MALPRPLAPVVSVLLRALHALSEFFRLEAAGGILLIAAAALALLCANSPLEELYDHFRELPVQVSVGDFAIAKPLLLWINDGLMAVFFLLVALEIKREALSGQLSSRAQITLPMICAAAGVAVPALIYAGDQSRRCRGDAWLGDPGGDRHRLRARRAVAARLTRADRMKLLLSTIAVVDDLIAIVIIALFYTSRLSVTALACAGAAIALMALLNRRGCLR